LDVLIPAVYTMNAEQRQTAADLWTKPTDLSHNPARLQTAVKLHPPSPFIPYSILSPKVDTHCTIPQRVEG